MVKQLISALFLIFICAIIICGQSSIEQAVNNARDQFSNIKNRSIELERVKREANQRPRRDTTTPKFPEIKEDFEQIQKLNTNALELTAAKTPVNYNTLLKFTSELNHRATRLKSNLFSAETKQKKSSPNNQSNSNESAEIKLLLSALDKSIDKFVHNSIFQNINVVNSQDSQNAQIDLDNIIKLSSSLKEITKKLTRDTAK